MFRYSRDCSYTTADWSKFLFCANDQKAEEVIKIVESVLLSVMEGGKRSSNAASALELLPLLMERIASKFGDMGKL